MWDPCAELQKFQLPNGLTIYLGTWDRPWLRATVMVHSGAREDPDGKEGTAHFLEHLLIENVQPWTYKTARHYFQEFGGSATFGTTYYDATSYDFAVPLENDNLERALNLFGHMMIDCKIEHRVERERQVIIREFTEYFPMRWMADRVLKRRQLLFPGTKLAKFAKSFGMPESILSISGTDIQAFYDRHYTPANMTIVAVGGLKPEDFARILEESPFGLEKPGIRTPLASAINHFDPPKENKLIHRISEYSSQVVAQSEIKSYVAIPGVISRKAMARVCDVLKDIFFREIRQRRGWTYGFSTSVQNFKEAYEFHVQGAFPWDGLEVIEDLVDECLVEAERSDDLIRHHIKASVMRYKITDISASELIDASIYDLRLHQRIVSLKEEGDVAASVTVEEVKAIFALLSRDRRWTIIVHP